MRLIAIVRQGQIRLYSQQGIGETLLSSLLRHDVLSEVVEARKRRAEERLAMALDDLFNVQVDSALRNGEEKDE